MTYAVALIPGDGIGPEITAQTVRALEATGIRIAWDIQQAGMTADQMAQNFIEMHRPSSLIHRFASVEEVANMVVYVCSKEASATNGAALRVDGGVVHSVEGRLERAAPVGTSHHVDAFFPGEHCRQQVQQMLHV